VFAAAAEAFQAEAAGAGEEVVDDRIGQMGREGVEDRLLGAIGDGASEIGVGGEELSAAELTGDDAHVANV